MPEPEEDETQWLEKRLDAMDNQLSSLTTKMEALSSLNLLPQLEKLQTAVDNLPVSKQTTPEVEARITAIQEKLEALGDLLTQAKPPNNAPPEPEKSGEGPKVPVTQEPPKPDQPKSQRSRLRPI